jgi:hypothetical protein
MKRFPLVALILVTLLLGVSVANAQTYDLQFVLAQNDGVVYAVTAQIRSNVSTFGMGISNLVFTYDSSAIGTPVLDSAFIFNSGLYNAITLTTPAANRVSINIVYNGGSGSGTIVPASFVNVVRIRFKTKKGAGHSTLQWRSVTPSQTGAFNDAAALVTRGTLFSFDTILLGIIGSTPGTLPTEYSLSQNYPNPFNPSTTIKYGIPRASAVTLRVFNSLGQQVAVLIDRTQDAGFHEVKFDGSAMASGVYFYRLKAGDYVETKKLVMVR